MPNVLFVGHAASRSGAPILLLQFMRWLKTNSDVTFDAMVVNDGPLLADMRAIAPTSVIDSWPSLPSRAARKIIGARRWSEHRDRTFRGNVRARGYDLAYVNTVVPAREIGLISEVGIPIICHVHELDFAMMAMVGESRIRQLIPHVAHFIAASHAVGDYLRGRWGIPDSNISVIHEFTSPPSAALDNSEARRRTRAELDVGDDEILIGGCGTLDWRKGADLFLQVARLISARGSAPVIKFVWVGGNSAHPDTQRFLHDVKASGLSKRVRVVEVTPEPDRYYAAMDLFALTSREDPFPLAMLEAAAARLPIVCFAGSGGGPEFVEQDARCIAPYMDVEAFADRLTALATDPLLRQQLGDSARERVTSRYTIQLQAPKLLKVVERFSTPTRRR